MKGKYLQFGLGMIAGITLLTTASAAVDYLQAKPSSQPVYVDGQKVEMEAYFIHNNNFMKLRDIGEAVGFNVYWDAASGSVQIESDKPYTGVAPAGQTSGALTEESVKAILWGLMDQYPKGTYYGAYYRSTSNGPYGMTPSNCAGWATLCSDAAFGDLPWRRIENPRWEQIRIGDLVRYDNTEGGHVVVVLDKTDEYILTTESGTNNKARWGGQYFKWWLEEQSGYRLFTRYPQ